MLKLNSTHFLTGEELSQQELLDLIACAEVLRKSRIDQEAISSQVSMLSSMQSSVQKTLTGKTLALIFEKPSLRTRVSFTVGVQELGGATIELTASQKKNEDPEDTIRVLQGMVQGVMLRTFEHEILERMVSKANIPVINGLSDLHHPCQALADLQTLQQFFGKLEGLKLAYIGDGNNVLHSLLLLLPFAGVDVHYSCPAGFEPDPEILARAQARATQVGSTIKKFATAAEAASGVNAIYTDVWTSMGFESSDPAKDQERNQAFADYQLNLELYNRALPNAIVMHCLPMVKGQEITAEMAEHPRSALFAQAENRLHAQKALMIGIYEGQRVPQAAGTSAYTKDIDLRH